MFALLFLRPPLFLVVLTSFLFMVASLFIDSLFVYWVAAFALFFLALLISLIHSKAETRIYKALAGIPLFMYYQLLSLLRVRKANKISVATQHYHNKTIDELNP
jgi:hypothetical protein